MYQLDLDLTSELDELVVSATVARLDLRDPKSAEGAYWLLDRGGPLRHIGPVRGPLDMDLTVSVEAAEIPEDLATVVAAWRAAV